MFLIFMDGFHRFEFLFHLREMLSSYLVDMTLIVMSFLAMSLVRGEQLWYRLHVIGTMQIVLV